MNPQDLENFLKKNIPMALHMGISILSCNENSLVAEAPLKENQNDKGTGFAGSLYSLCALSSWGFIRSLLIDKNLNCDIMMHTSEIVFQKPVLDDITAIAKPENPEELKSFIEKLKQEGKSRIEINVNVISGNDLKAVFKGSLVAVKK